MNKEYTENNGKYKQLSAEERGKIEAYRSLNCSISKIAGLINRSKNQRFTKKSSEGNTMVDTRRALLKTERKRDEESRTNTRNGKTPSF